jgi:hypothetical protein
MALIGFIPRTSCIPILNECNVTVLRHGGSLQEKSLRPAFCYQTVFCFLAGHVSESCIKQSGTGAFSKRMAISEIAGECEAHSVLSIQIYKLLASVFSV